MRGAQDLDVLDPPEVSGIGGLKWSIPVALATVIADLLTKEWALDRLVSGSCSVPGNCIDLAFGAKLHLVFNTGAAFAKGTGFGPILGVLAGVITLGLLGMSRFRADRFGPGLLGLIAGGAIGNLIDRAFRADDGFLSGAVVDFVDLGWWPVFNVADAAIVCGVVASIWFMWVTEDDPAEVEEVRPVDELVNEQGLDTPNL